MTAVAVWEHPPSADDLLRERLLAGWRPTPSYLQAGLAVLGHAASVSQDLWIGSGCAVPRRPPV